MKSRADVDPARIGLWGGSYGGYLTAMGLSRASDLFAAGVDFHGVHDWNQGIRTFVPDYNVLDDPDFSRRAFASSPMASVDTWKSPVLLIHGDDDRNVSFIESINLITALRKAQRRGRAAGVPGRGPRLPAPPELGARLQGDGGVLQPPPEDTRRPPRRSAGGQVRAPTDDGQRDALGGNVETTRSSCVLADLRLVAYTTTSRLGGRRASPSCALNQTSDCRMRRCASATVIRPPTLTSSLRMPAYVSPSAPSRIVTGPDTFEES